MKKALQWKPLDGGKVACTLCGHGCVIPEGAQGLCRVRQNMGGALYALTYGRYSGVSPDPVEKKPLYHFMPGTRTLSFGSVGCNLRCHFCQNYEISNEWSLAQTRELDAGSLPAMVARQNCKSVSWTYNEPTMWYEFTLEASRLLRKEGIPSIYVTNGYMSEGALRELAPSLDAMNVDVKAFTEDFYRTLTNGRLAKVLETCVLAKELGIWLELTNLVIPLKNDGDSELESFARWVVGSLGPDVPVHFSRFHPDYKMLDTRHTPVETLARASAIAKGAGLRYVYMGNIKTHDGENTRCSSCGELLIARMGYHVADKIKNGTACPRCGTEAAIVRAPGWMRG
jgi:pyruvate formate lyase activating enzyme